MRSATILTLVAFAALAACAKKEAPMEPVPMDVTVEPTETGKYK